MGLGFSKTCAGSAQHPDDVKSQRLQLNLKLTDAEQAALWEELDEDGSGALTFLEIQTAVSDRERKAAEAKQAKEAERLRAEKALKHSSEVSKEVLQTADAWDQLNAFIHRNGGPAMRAFLSGFDSTGHSTLSKEEFRNALRFGLRGYLPFGRTKGMDRKMPSWSSCFLLLRIELCSR